MTTAATRSSSALVQMMCPMLLESVSDCNQAEGKEGVRCLSMMRLMQLESVSDIKHTQTNTPHNVQSLGAHGMHSKWTAHSPTP